MLTRPIAAGGGQPPLVVGVDIGTTSVKAVAYDTGGAAWAQAEQELRLSAPAPGRAEQDPEEILDTVLRVLARVCGAAASRGGRVAGVALSAAMHGVIAFDRHARPLTPSMTWADNRSAQQTAALLSSAQGRSLTARTGTPTHPMAPLTKLLWFREREPEIFARTAWWASAKELLLRRLFGRAVVDHSIASATGLFNLRERDWDAEALELAGVARGQLSETVPTTQVLSGLAPGLADRIGVRPGTPFVVGASDGVLANVGAGAVEEGMAVCTVGTSGAIRALSARPDTDALGRTFCYALTDRLWVIGGPINNGGIVLRWLRDEVFPGSAADADGYERLTRLAARAPVGSEGLVFLPFLTGERAPQWDPDLRGVVFGLGLRHGRDHLVRAAMEGVMYQLLSVARVLEELGRPPTQLRATGGFARSSLWLQIMADVFGHDIAVPVSHEGSCLGAALLGMQALGLVESLRVANGLVRVERVQRPIPANVAAYRPLYELFARLGERLRPEFTRLGGVRADLTGPPPAP